MSTDVPVLDKLPISRPDGCPFDPPEELGQARQASPVTRMTFPDGHVGWLVTSHQLARAVLADNRFSARGDLIRVPVPIPGADQPRPQVPPGFFSRMDPPEHTRYRRLLTGQFTVRRMKQLEPRVEQITTEHLDAMERHGPPADLVELFARPIPSLVICELLGVPYADRAVFQDNTAVVFRADTTTMEQRMTAWQAIGTFLGELVAAKRAEPADDLLSGLVTSGELTDVELVNIGVTLLVAGHETTANMLALGPFALLQHPDQLAKLRADPALVEHAVEELLRYLSIVHVGPVRTALEDVELVGRHITAGDSVVVSLPAANRDPAHFEEPDTLNLQHSTAGHVAFGHGVHQCLGQQLARLEMRVAYPALLRRFPNLRLAVPPEEVPMRGDMALYGVYRLPVTWSRS